MATHIPVLLTAVTGFLDPAPGRCFIDATVGGGGHAAALLEGTAPDGRLLGLDRDADSLAAVEPRLQVYGSRVVLAHANFSDIAAVASDRGFHDVDGILADIGMSSMMVDSPERGFSFMSEGPLDMRMDRSQRLTAGEIVNRYSEREIADILFQFGEERRSRPIARSIVHVRPLHTTFDLVRAVERVTGPRRFGRIHPATQTFQGLRIAVNDELAALEKFLNEAPDLLRPGGRLAVISFHSLEDRMVKVKLKSLADRGRVLTKKVIVAGDDEVRSNSRARSAKLRVWERSQ